MKEGGGRGVDAAVLGEGRVVEIDPGRGDGRDTGVVEAGADGTTDRRVTRVLAVNIDTGS